MKIIKLNTLLMLLVFLLGSTGLSAQSWSTLGNGMDDYVNAIAEFNGDIIAGGSFVTADGLTVNNIARWDGTSWHAMGVGMNGQVDALIVYNGALIAGGRFLKAGGNPVNFIARWDGTSWTALHTGTDNYVTCLAVYNGKLIAGGYFSVATTVANFIAQWDGTSWSNVGSGMGGAQAQVMALSVYGSDLIAGGYFTLAGGVSVGHIAKWNGTAWSGLDGGIDNIVFSLTTYGSKLYAGGLFDHAGGLSAKSIAAWDGTSWSPLGAGIGGSVALNVMALQVYNNRLIVGGLFQTAGGITVNSVARWDGSNWSALGNGVTYGGATSNINALAAIGSELIAGGVFDMAGLVNANYIAHWTEPPVGIETPVFSGSADFSLSQNYPEPCRAATTISFQIPSSAAVKLAVYDGSGREIAILLDENLTAGSHAVVCKTADYPAGFYFYRLQHNQRLLCRKMCVVN